MLYWYLRVRNWLAEREEGQDLVEYALLLVLIALVVIVAVTDVGTRVKEIFQEIPEKLVVPS